MLTIADLWKQGKIIINRIRFGLVLLFLLAMIGAKDEFQPKMFLIHMMGTCIMGFYCAIAYFLERKSNPPTWFHKILILMDTLVLSFTIILDCSLSLQEAEAALANAVVYFIFFFNAIYSGFLGDRKFVLINSLLGSILVAVALVVAVKIGGVQLSVDPEQSRQIGYVGLAGEVMKPIFIMIAGYIVSLLVQLLTKISSLAEIKAEEAEMLLGQTKERNKVSANAAIKLESSIINFSKFVSDTSLKLESQAASLEEITAVISELSSSFESNGASIEEQNTKVQRMVSDTVELKETVDQILIQSEQLVEIAEMNKKESMSVTEVADQTATHLESIQASFDQVNEINNIVAEIGEKTNLLALNASIEAARAGDVGKGFAVVANEVSKLAEFTKNNVKRIATVVKSSKEIISNARYASQSTGELAKSQIDRLNQTLMQIQNMNQLYVEQRNTLSSILSELSQIRELSNQIAGSTKEQLLGQKEASKGIIQLEMEVNEISRASKDLEEHIQMIKEEANILASMGSNESK
ncbi:methyl-accepting chemotaxis protein [Leptospira jelokensis]|uniref:methyl-accepting chemotaxis protein n=1 Tax=Leptospira jelokensis TaxID=2484931 RepID=UPI0010915BB6|nr:methyl-accepting chemotaxis protein [Leptospira jelokensis]TGM01941.1 chemotaxis protein [Leptospira jelokensis]